MIEDVLKRGLNDILRAEREMRGIAEKQNRSLRDVLSELAYRLAGEALENIRRRDPQAPDNWDAAAWRAFFVEQLEETPGWSKPEVIRERMEAVRQERDGLAGRLAEALSEIDRLKSIKPDGNGHKEHNAEAKPEDAVNEAINDADKWPDIPKKPPMRFASKLSTGQRWKREALALYLMATKGWSLRLEVLEAIGRLTNVSPRSGSLKRIFEKGLKEKGLVDSAVLSINLSKGQTRMSVLRLTDQGRDLCRLLGWEPIESEWERLVRLHEGGKQTAHTAAVLTFAYHARTRGWNAEVLPEVDGTNAIPDISVEKDDKKVYVEVELGADKTAKWRNLAKLQGFVALCASTADKRNGLVNECKLDRIKGRATDIETLIQESGGVKGNLWPETW